MNRKLGYTGIPPRIPKKPKNTATAKGTMLYRLMKQKKVKFGDIAGLLQLDRKTLNYKLRGERGGMKYCEQFTVWQTYFSEFTFTDLWGEKYV